MKKNTRNWVSKNAKSTESNISSGNSNSAVEISNAGNIGNSMNSASSEQTNAGTGSSSLSATAKAFVPKGTVASPAESTGNNNNNNGNLESETSGNRSSTSERGGRRGRGRGGKNPNPPRQRNPNQKKGEKEESAEVSTESNNNGKEEKSEVSTNAVGSTTAESAADAKAEKEANPQKEKKPRQRKPKPPKKEQNTPVQKQPEIGQPRPTQQQPKPTNVQKGKTNLNLELYSPLASNIIERIQSNSYECLICTDVIKSSVTVWTCHNCYMMFHIFCIKKWSKASEEGKISGPFRCPGCQYVHTEKPIPKCFCGKIEDPPYNPYVLPHSCGEICGKSRVGQDCPHTCTLACHPGHCPPCAAMGPLKHCYCGNLTYRLRCGQKDPGRSCGEVCNKPLNCKKHKCKQICHTGPCSPCSVTETQSCFCGKTKDEKFCGSGVFNPETHHNQYSCNHPCGKKLGCGNHECEQICHPGKCNECQLLPKFIVNCPCGKIPLELLSAKPRKDCSEPVPTCPNVCGKLLLCGQHTCTQMCHTGPCPTCTQSVKAPCVCKSTFFTAPCAKVNGKEKNAELLSCNKICKATRICGRHQCGKKCCPSSSQADPHGIDASGSHVCNLICDKKLKCGKHKCDLLCHSGRCPPCHITMHDPYVCECGFTRLEPPILCGTPIPECPQICVRHRACGHPNTHLCHSRDTLCPNCTVTTEKVCIGGHGIKKMVPCLTTNVSCGRTCGKSMSCGVHTCKRSCHGDPCQNNPDPSTCGQPCGKKRELCSHLCASPCHGDRPCPKEQCKELIRVSCSCGRRSAEVECLRGGETDSEFKSNRELLCDEQCEIEARNRRLAEAFGISPDRISGSSTQYPDVLLQLGKPNLAFVQKLEQKFSEVVRSNISVRYTFPPMDSIHRRLVHELAKFYNIDTESLDREPNRTVSIYKKSISKIPTVLLSTAIVEKSKQQKLAAQQPISQPVAAQPDYFGIQISNFDSNKAPQQLNALLLPFAGEYQVKWLNESTALVAFTDENLMKTSLAVLAGSPYAIKEHKGPIEFDPPKQKVPKTKSAPAATVFKSEPEFANSNPFELLAKPSSATTTSTTTTTTTTTTAPAPVAKATTAPSEEGSLPTKVVGNWADLIDSDDL